MHDEMFFDTSILVYAFDSSERDKHEVALGLVQDIMANRGKGIVSGQVLAELYNVLTEHVSDPLSGDEVGAIISDFIDASSWIKLDYRTATVKRAANGSAKHGVKIWDALIAETMKENEIDTIVTENEKDFRKIPGIKIINPFTPGK